MVMAPLMDGKTLGRIAGRVVWDRTPRRFSSLSQLSDIRVTFASLDLRVLACTLSIGRNGKDFSEASTNIPYDKVGYVFARHLSYNWTV